MGRRRSSVAYTTIVYDVRMVVIIARDAGGAGYLLCDRNIANIYNGAMWNQCSPLILFCEFGGPHF